MHNDDITVLFGGNGQSAATTEGEAQHRQQCGCTKMTGQKDDILILFWTFLHLPPRAPLLKCGP